MPSKHHCKGVRNNYRQEELFSDLQNDSNTLILNEEKLIPTVLKRSPYSHEKKFIFEIIFANSRGGLFFEIKSTELVFGVLWYLNFAIRELGSASDPCILSQLKRQLIFHQFYQIKKTC